MGFTKGNLTGFCLYNWGSKFLDHASTGLRTLGFQGLRRSLQEQTLQPELFNQAARFGLSGYEIEAFSIWKWPLCNHSKLCADQAQIGCPWLLTLLASGAENCLLKDIWKIMEFDDQISIAVVVVVVGKLTVLLLSPSPLSGASFQSSFRKDEKAC